MKGILKDLHFGIRMFAKSPVFLELLSKVVFRRLIQAAA